MAWPAARLSMELVTEMSVPTYGGQLPMVNRTGRSGGSSGRPLIGCETGREYSLKEHASVGRFRTDTLSDTQTQNIGWKRADDLDAMQSCKRTPNDVLDMGGHGP